MRNMQRDPFEQYDALPEATAEWFLPELHSVMRSRRATEDLGLRRLLEFPEAIGPRIRGLRRADPELLEQLSDPEWPDAA